MAGEVTTLTLGVDSSQVKKASKDLDGLSVAGTKADKSSAAMGRSMKLLGSAIASLGIAQLIRSTIQQADAYANISARIKLAAGSTEAYNRAQREVFAIAQRTRSDLGATADLYGSLARNAADLGASQTDILRVTETINKSFQISGASAASAGAAVIQLSQAFASGTLRGDELNSVMEQSPRLARAIADGLKVNIGELRKLGSEGKLTAAQVFGALAEAGRDIDREFGKLPQTVGGASVQVGNSLLKLIGTIDKLTGTTPAIAGWGRGFSSQIDAVSNSLQRGEKDVRGYIDALIVLARNSPLALSALILARRAFPNVPSDEQSFDDKSRLDPRQGRGFQTPEVIAQQKARLEFLGLFASKQERVNAELAKYRKLLGDSFTAEDERRIRDKFGDKNTFTLGGIRNLTDKRKQDFLIHEKDAYEQIAQMEREAAAASKEALEQQAEARVRIGQISQRAIDQAYEETEAMVQSNLTLRDEVALIGKSAEERSKLEQARIGSMIAAKEEALILAQSNDAGAEQIALLERQIQLLKNRDQLVGQRGVLQEQADQIQKSADAAKELGRTFQSAFEDAVIGGKKLSDVLKGLADDVLRIFLRKSVSEPLGGFFSNLFGGFNIGSLFGFRANGGPVSAGSPYIVGERGPELMVPGRSGYVVPNSQMGQGVVINQTLNIGQGVSRSEVFAAAMQAKEAAKSELLQTLRRQRAMA